MLICAICDAASLCLYADSPQLSGLRVAALRIDLSHRLLHILLRLIPVLHPTSVELCSGPVALGRTAHGAVTLRNVAGLFGQLVLVDEAAFLVAGFLRVGPWLFLPRREEPIKHHTTVMHERGDEEDVLPLFSSLETENSCSQAESLLRGLGDVIKGQFTSKSKMINR